MTAADPNAVVDEAVYTLSGALAALSDAQASIRAALADLHAEADRLANLLRAVSAAHDALRAIARPPAL